MKKLFEDKKDIFVIWTIDGIAGSPKRASKQFVYVDKYGMAKVKWLGRMINAEIVDGGLLIRRFAYTGRSTTLAKLVNAN